MWKASHGGTSIIIVQRPKLSCNAPILPKGEYVVATRESLSQTTSPNGRGTQSRNKQASQTHAPLKPNTTKKEAKALKELKQDKHRLVLTTEKGMSLVVLGRQTTSIKPKTLWQIGALIDL